MTDQSIDHDVLAHYSAALDEIRRLRIALAYEAAVLAVHLDYATFPKSRRMVAEGQVNRMRHAARGGSQAAYADVSLLSLKHTADEVGGPAKLTRADWESRYDTPQTNAAHVAQEG